MSQRWLLESRMFAWFKRTFGKGSRVDRLIRALPNPDRIAAGIEAKASLFRDWGDKFAAWDAAESQLVHVLVATADANDWAGSLIDGVVGDDKRQALSVVLRRAASSLGIIDKSFDLAWEKKLRPVLDDYIARLRG